MKVDATENTVEPTTEIIDNEKKNDINDEVINEYEYSTSDDDSAYHYNGNLVYGYNTQRIN